MAWKGVVCVLNLLYYIIVPSYLQVIERTILSDPPAKLCVAVRTGIGGDAPHMFVQGGKHRRRATRYTGTK